MDVRDKNSSTDSIASARLKSFEAALHTHGLVYGFLMEPDRPIQELTWDDLSTALGHPNALVWIHFNVANAHAKQWIERCERLPEALRDFLLNIDDRQRVETAGEGVIGVIGDVHYGFDFDPDQIATLRFYLDSHCLISTRRQPLSATDRLRTAIRDGVRFGSTVTLMVSLFQFQAEMLVSITTRLTPELGEIEDEILAGRLQDQRRALGRIRRLAVRLHRHFAPEYRALRRLCGRPPAWFDDIDVASFRETTDEFGVVVDDLDAIQERAKLLQEELAGRVAEETNHNLFVLSIVTAVLLPVTLITGIFGMNVAGLPGLQDPAAFWWVMLGMMAVAALALLLLHWKRLF